MKTTHLELKIRGLDVLLNMVIGSPISALRGTKAGKGGMLWHRLYTLHIGGRAKNSVL